MQTMDGNAYRQRMGGRVRDDGRIGREGKREGEEE